MKYLIAIFSVFIVLNVVNADTDLYKLSNEICKDCSTDEQKVVALREHVYEKMKPNGNGYNLEDVRSNSLMWCYENGVGWCDTQARVFMHLAREQGISTRLIFLLSPCMHTSPHTIAEAKIDNRWVVVDVGNNYDFRYNNRLATRNDMAAYFDKVVLSVVPEMPEQECPHCKRKYDYWKIFTNGAWTVTTMEP